jgi:hypothetical protein
LASKREIAQHPKSTVPIGFVFSNPAPWALGVGVWVRFFNLAPPAFAWVRFFKSPRALASKREIATHPRRLSQLGSFFQIIPANWLRSAECLAVRPALSSSPVRPAPVSAYNGYFPCV